MPRTNSRWLYDTDAPSADFKGPRSATKKPYASELVGVDGNTEGGLKPFRGFQPMVSQNGIGTPAVAKELHRLRVVDIHPFTMQVGSDGLIYGYVFRVKNKDTIGTSNAGCSLYMFSINATASAANDPDRNTWLLDTGVPGPREFTDSSQRLANGRNMQVTSQGRFLYIGIEGHPMITVWNSQDAATDNIAASDFGGVGGTGGGTTPLTGANFGTVKMGPGLRPTLIDDEKWPSLNGSITVPTSNAVGYGGVFVTEFALDELAYTPKTKGTVGSQRDVGQDVDDTTSLEPGDYAFAYQLQDKATGRRSSLSTIAWARLRTFVPPAASSNDPQNLLEGVPKYAYYDIAYDSDKYDQVLLYRSVRTQDGGGSQGAAILHLEKIIDMDEYGATAAGSITQSTGSTWSRFIYCVELEDKALVYQPTYLDGSFVDEEVPRGGALAMYEGSLFVGSIADPQIPASLGYLKNEIANTGAGEIRYSSLIEQTPEHFPAQNRYAPRQGGSSVTRFEQVGNVLMGWSSDRIFMFRKEGSYLGQPVEMHKGYGLVNPYALSVVGETAYYVCTHGVKAVQSNGRLSNVSALDQLILENWKDALHWLSMAFDSSLNAIFLLNGKQHECVVMWLNTNRVTTLKYAPFSMCATAQWSEGQNINVSGLYRETTNGLVRRALFIEDKPYSTPIADDPTQYPRIFAPADRDAYHDQGLVDNTVIRNMARGSGDTRFTLARDFPDDILVQPRALYVDTSAGEYPADLTRSFYVHVVEAADENLVGRTARLDMDADWLELTDDSSELQTGILHTTGDNEAALSLSSDTYTNFFGLQAGDKVVIAPVYFEWQGYPLEVVSQEGYTFAQAEDFFRPRNVEALGCVFTDVSGSGLSDSKSFNKFEGLLYIGNEETPSYEQLAKKHDGTFPESVSDGVVPYYSSFGQRHGVRDVVVTPGVRVVCTDLDFRLRAVLVKGQTEDVERTDRGTS